MIFVTGGTGLLGSHLLFELTKNECLVKAIYRDANKIQQVKKVFQYYNPTCYEIQFSKIQWIECDINDIVTIEDVISEADYVYHCAALVSFYRRDFNKLMKINREGTSNIVNACLKNKVKKLCYVSSTAAIGSSDSVVTEESKWKQSEKASGYSISKYSAEKEVWRGSEEGLNVVIVNPSMIFGAGDWNESSLTIFKTIQKGLPFYTSGSNAFVDVRDVVKVMIALMKSNISKERYLVTGTNISFKDAFKLIALKLGKKPANIAVPKWLISLTWIVSGIVSRIVGKKPTITKETANSAFNNTKYDSSKIIKELDIKFRSLEESIDNTIRFNLESKI